ncbi:hypothetical protein R6Q59_026174 [Mikania micrantha]
MLCFGLSYLTCLTWVKLDKIPSKENLQKREINMDTSCTLCGYTLESSDHTLIRCKIASEVWNKVMNWCEIPRDLIFTIKDILTIHYTWPYQEKMKNLIHGILLTSLWIL